MINRVKLTALGLAAVLGVSACGATTPGAATNCGMTRLFSLSACEAKTRARASA